jgi:hypothetical protein
MPINSLLNRYQMNHKDHNEKDNIDYVDVPAYQPKREKVEFNQEVVDELCDRIACGESVRSITQDHHMPALHTLMRELRVNKPLRQCYARAFIEQGDANADEVIYISDLVAQKKIGYNEGRIAIDARKWAAGKRQPTKYGPDVLLEDGGDNASKPTRYVLSPVQVVARVDTDDSADTDS